jgi:hypothetical protein
MKNSGMKLILEIKKGGTKNGRKESKMEGSKEGKKAGLYQCTWLSTAFVLLDSSALWKQSTHKSLAILMNTIYVCMCMCSCTAVCARMSAKRQYYSNWPSIFLKTFLGLALVRALFLKDCFCYVLKPTVGANVTCRMITIHQSSRNNNNNNNNNNNSKQNTMQ